MSCLLWPSVVFTTKKREFKNWPCKTYWLYIIFRAIHSQAGTKDSIFQYACNSLLSRTNTFYCWFVKAILSSQLSPLGVLFACYFQRTFSQMFVDDFSRRLWANLCLLEENPTQHRKVRLSISHFSSKSFCSVLVNNTKHIQFIFSKCKWLIACI